MEMQWCIIDSYTNIEMGKVKASLTKFLLFGRVTINFCYNGFFSKLSNCWGATLAGTMVRSINKTLDVALATPVNIVTKALKIIRPKEMLSKLESCWSAI